MAAQFEGFKPEAYRFLMEIRFNNNKQWMDENRERYREYVQRPMQRLASLLLPDMMAIDPLFNPRITSIVSRINRDTRYSLNKQPYRDHAWIGFRREGKRMGESLCIYFEISPESYGYGIGMYSPNAAFMADMRKRAAADPESVRRVVRAIALERFAVEGEPYKKDRCAAVPEDLKPYLNRKGIGWHYSSSTLAPTMQPAIYDEVRAAMLDLAPVYALLAPSLDI